MALSPPGPDIPSAASVAHLVNTCQTPFEHDPLDRGTPQTHPAGRQVLHSRGRPPRERDAGHLSSPSSPASRAPPAKGPWRASGSDRPGPGSRTTTSTSPFRQGARRGRSRATCVLRPWRGRSVTSTLRSQCARSRQPSLYPPSGRRASSSWEMRAPRSAARARASPRSTGTP